MGAAPPRVWYKWAMVMGVKKDKARALLGGWVGGC